jgi:hypothetical protein
MDRPLNPKVQLINCNLSTITALARAGALDQAWRLFVRGGHVALTNPATLAVKGRLLKDRAHRADGAAREHLFTEAAEAYASAADLGGATYPLINAATLSLLAGDAVRAAQLAKQVLTRIAERPDEPETPYYRAATRAEALLLRGNETGAQAALAEAISLAPRAWEDHASTLRQFALILAAQGKDAGWLEPLRPPRSLHFGGHMSFRADAAPTPLTAEIATVLAEERIGFGYGALAAGADILIAEALLARDAELHLIIPGGIEAFAALSVDPFGADWRRRFDAIIARAETVRSVEPVGVLPDTVAIGLADEIAMGAARINAQRLASAAVQLLVIANGEPEARSHAIWAAGGAGTQRVLEAPRQPVEPAPGAPPATQRCLAALAIRVEPAVLGKIAPVLAQGAAPAVPPSFTGEAVVLAFDRLSDAAACATALVAALPEATIGGYYGVAETVADPFGGGTRLVGRALAIAKAAAASAPPGSACVSDDFAAALAVAEPERFHAEYVGELEGEGAALVGLFALRRL